MKKWEFLEQYIAPNVRFNSAGMAQTAGLSRHQTSDYIQSYLDAMRRPNARTKYVIRREGRTRSAVWVPGVRTADVRARTSQAIDDMACSVTRALRPDLERMGLLNPRCSPVVQAHVNAMVANLQAMAVSFNSGP